MKKACPRCGDKNPKEKTEHGWKSICRKCNIQYGEYTSNGKEIFFPVMFKAMFLSLVRPKQKMKNHIDIKGAEKDMPEDENRAFEEKD